MANKLFTGLSSLLLPLGLYGVPAYSSSGYQRNSYLSAGASIPHNPLATSASSAQLLQSMAEVDASDLDIVAANPVKELVIIDAAVPDKQVFYRALKPGVAVAEIDSSQPGLEQLKKILGNYRDLAAVHIVSHAQAGELLLGNSHITADTIKQEVGTFAALNGAVRDGGDLLFYGCDLAASAAGEELLDIIQHNTHLDVAASSNLTGNLAQGGDWDLEIQRGHIDTQIAFSEKALKDFSSVLGTFTLSGFTYHTPYSTNDCPSDAGGSSYQYSSLTSGSYTVCGFVAINGFGGTTVNVKNNYGGPVDAYLAPTNPITSSGTHFFDIRRTSGVFQLSQVVAQEFSGSTTFTSVKVVGYLSGGGTVESTAITSDSSSVNTFTFSGAAMSSFVGANLTKFRLVLVNASGSNIAYLGLKSFDATQDSTPPAVSSITLSGSPAANATSVTYVVAFDETANNISTDDFQLTTTGTASGTISSVSASSGSSVNVTVNSISGAGTLRLDLISNTNIVDASGNGNNNNGYVAAYSSGSTHTVDMSPTVTDGNISISGASGTGGAYKIGDTVTATWNNTAGGDNNSGITGVTVDFSQFGGGSAVAASNSSGTWTATYVITSGAVDNTNRNVSVTATNASGNKTLADTTNATVDNIAPTVTDGNISISGASGAGGTYKIGDTVTATWNNTAGGDNNSDTISSVTADFSAFGGGSAVSASNSAGTWTATYTITAGAIDGTNKNISITATDNAGNTTATADTSNAAVDNVGPIVTDGNISISGASGTGGAFIIGDTVTATWNNTAGGDNNTDTISSVTADFSAFGGGSAVSASNSAGTWTATYTITTGAIDGTNKNISITATDNAGNATATADTSNATVDNLGPTVTDGNISISGASGTGGAFIIGDTVTATWNNTAGGDNNTDTISSVTADFSAFGGGSAVSASNSAGTWTATYTITAGAIDGTNKNISITATDNAGNATATADTSNATVDNIAPTLTDTNISISGASGTGGAYIIGDTVTATWDSSASGDNNTDTLASVNVDFSQFGGGSAVSASNSGGIWTATYTLVAGAINASNRNVSLTVSDNAGNLKTTADTSNATVDTSAPVGHSVSFDDSAINGSEASAISFTFAGAEVGASYSYTISSSGGGTPVTGSGTIATATDQISSINVSGLTDGTLTLSVTLTDSAGNAAAAVTDTATLDITAPAAPSTPDLDSLSDSGSSNTDDITNNTTPTIIGTAEAGSTVTLYDTDGTTVLGSAVATGGNWSITSSALSEGAHTLSAKATDAASNVSVSSSSLVVTIDTTAPAKPAVPDLADASDAGASNTDDITNLVSLTLQGTAGSVEADTQLHARSTLDGGLTNGTANADGSWSFAVLSLTEGTHGLSIQATDAAGNTSAYSDALSVIVDQTLPAITGVAFDQASVLAANQTAISFSLAGAETSTKASYSITSSNGGTPVTATDVDISAANQQISGVNLSGLTDGTLTLSLTLTDAAGNSSSAQTDTITKDTDAPVNNVPGAQTTTTVEPIVFQGANYIGVSDGGSLTTVVSVGSGSLTAITSGSAGVSGNGTASVTITGTASEVNTALNGMTFAPGGSGSVTINVVSTDSVGNSDSDTIDVTVDNSTLVVTSNLDTGVDASFDGSYAADQADGNGLSVREALNWARAGDTVTFDLDSGTAGNQGGTITLNGSELMINYANLTIDGDLDDDGSADVTISANNASRVLEVAASLSGVEISGMTLTEGVAAGGGGISLNSGANITVRDSNITNSSDSGLGGGGIYGSAATLTLINTTVSGNTSLSFGGGVRLVGGGTLNLINSTITGNTTTGASAHGGGIQFAGAGLTLINTTISGNATLGASADAGGLRITTGPAFVYNSTIVGNAAAGNGGGVSANGTDTFINTVVAGNTAGAGATAAASGSPLATGGSANDVSGTVETATNSYFGTTTTITSDTNNLNNQGTSNLLLGDLAYNNSGDVQTHKPQAGSALLEAGSNASLPADTFDLDGDSDTLEALPVDANGNPRVSNVVDIGAVEANAVPAVSGVDGGNTYVEGGSAVVIDGDASVSDSDLEPLNSGNGDYNNTSIVVARNGGLVTSDSFGFNDGNGISLSTNTLVKNSQVIASFDTTTAGQLTVSFTNANGEIPTSADVNFVLEQLTFSSTSNDPDASATLDITFNDDAGASVTAQAVVNITSVNDAPTLTLTSANPSFSENGSAVNVYSAAAASTVESGQTFTALSVSVTNLANGASEILTVDGTDIPLTNGNSGTTSGNSLGYSVSVSGSNATITFTMSGLNSATLQTLVNAISYSNSSDAISNGTRVVSIDSLTDNGGTANGGADTAALSLQSTVTLTAANDAPVISGVATTSVNQNAGYSFVPAASDLDGDGLTFSIINQPAWASFNSATGELSGTPANADVGTTSGIVISVSDGALSASLSAFNLTVINVNDAPTITGTPAITTAEDAAYSFTPTAGDIDAGDTLTFSIVNKPSWASFNGATGALTGTPANADVGTTNGIVISVNDGTVSTSLSAFNLTVTNVNDAPTISGTPATSVAQDAAYSFTPTASDVDVGDVLTFSISNKPSWASFDTATGALTGTPANADVGTTSGIVISVNDGTVTTNLSAFNLTVTNVNDAPTITGTPTVTVNEDSAYSFVPVGTDVDASTTLTYNIVNQPSWASFNAATGALTGTPTNADVGTTNGIVISVSDGSLSASLPAFNLTVVNVNDAPVISGTPTTSLDQDVAYSFIPSASDDDAGDVLTFSITNKPNWASFDSATGALTGTPAHADVGTTTGIVISVSDGTTSTSLAPFNVEVKSTNAAPQISGSPALTAYIGEAYSFAPGSSDSDGDTLTFAATGLPAWMSLNTATGALTGMPSAVDLDASYTIGLSVTDGIDTTALADFVLQVKYKSLDPVLVLPADITINAKALYTQVNLAQLLGLSATANQDQVDAALKALASDSVSGHDCCTTAPEGLNNANRLLLAPGRHQITWTTTNAQGLKDTGVQMVDVRPLVSFAKPQVAIRGSQVSVRVVLNGLSPVYPLDIPLVVDSATSATAPEYSLSSTLAHFDNGGREASITVTLADLSNLGTSDLILGLDDQTPSGSAVTGGLNDINSGAVNTHRIHILEGNAPPVVKLSIKQGGLETTLVTPDGGDVTVNAQVTDLNTGDTHSYDWTATEAAILGAGTATDGSLVFSPEGLTGVHQLQVTVMDSAGASVDSQSLFRMVASLPQLQANTDSDGDGVDDQTEGLGDDNGNGIPNYLDNMVTDNILPEVGLITDGYLIECDPGVRCGVGRFALEGSGGGVQVLDNELGTLTGLRKDANFNPVGGVYDFVIQDLPTAGQTVRVVVPQQAAIPANAVYRKFQKGRWVTFVEDADNQLFSASGDAGYCPPPGSSDWQPGLNEGDLCVQLAVEDGGPNDADGLVNAAVADPGAVSAAIPVEPPPPPVDHHVKTKGSGAMGLWMLALLSLLVTPRRWGKALVAVILSALGLGAQAGSDTSGVQQYTRLDVYAAKTSQEQSDLEAGLKGFDVQITQYDNSRTAYGLAYGLQWSPMFYTEVGYLDLGDVTVDFTAAGDTDFAALNKALEAEYPITARGLTLTQGLMFKPAESWKVSTEFGFYLWGGDITTNDEAVKIDYDDNLDMLVGLRLEYMLNQHLSLGLGVKRVLFKYQDVQLTGVSASWQF